MRAAMLLAILAAPALAGCLSEIEAVVGPRTETTRSFACAMITSWPYPTVHIDVRTEAGMLYSPITAIDRIRDVLAEQSGRSRDAMTVQIQAVQVPDEGWSPVGWDELLADHQFRVDRRTVALLIVWTDDLPGDATGQVVRPGVVAISQADVRAKAFALGWAVDAAASAVLLHHVGHALGAVNQGIPMQANHEGAPGHDADVASVMHHGWERPGAHALATNATYDHYPDTVRADWTAAASDEGVCA